MNRIMSTAGTMAATAVALIVTGLALLTAPVWLVVLWLQDRKRDRA